MKLIEIAVDYRAEAEILKERIRQIKELPTETKAEELAKSDRLRILEAMRRDMRDMAVICERYYKNDYRMCEKYSVTYR